MPSNSTSMQDSIPFDRRLAEARRILQKYPDRVPVIVERAERSDLPEIEKKKFLVPGTMLCGEFKYIVHKHITQAAENNLADGQRGGAQGISAEQTIYLFVKKKTPRTGSMMSELYDAHKDEDGFLYLTYSAENTLGGEAFLLRQYALTRLSLRPVGMSLLRTAEPRIHLVTSIRLFTSWWHKWVDGSNPEDWTRKATANFLRSQKVAKATVKSD
ncbi:Gamma-aminobutyric acid receptor-associated protein-like 2 [Perkinsus olseni]|uniref:Autophagy-related protein n=1 Tax=Perkinsus olseni TaxID=32597 RepID=A0A7J6PLB4_PEROL|nr:Gamma-aminobutyric acid receptor-associated protein-like 2 [Perkinsus olseni]